MSKENESLAQKILPSVVAALVIGFFATMWFWVVDLQGQVRTLESQVTEITIKLRNFELWQADGNHFIAYENEQLVLGSMKNPKGGPLRWTFEPAREIK